MKYLIIISLLFSTLAMADKMAAYYDDTREDNGKIIGEYRICYYKNPGKTFDIFRLIPAGKECPLVVYLGEEKKQELQKDI